MSHTISHTLVLQASVDEIMEACKDMDNIFVDLLPQYIVSAKFLEGHGEHGSIRFVTMGPAIPHALSLKEQFMHKIDDATKTTKYTLLEGDARYNTFDVEVHFEAKANIQTEATWTTKFTPLGDMDPPKDVKAIVELVFKAMEKAIYKKRSFMHTETLDGSPDASWEHIMLKELPKLLESSTLFHGHSGPGNVGLLKMTLRRLM